MATTGLLATEPIGTTGELSDQVQGGLQLIVLAGAVPAMVLLLISALTLSWLAGIGSVLVLVAGVCLAESRASGKFICPACDTPILKNQSSLPWTKTTGRCPKCALSVLEVEEPRIAGTKLSLAKLRRRVHFQFTWLPVVLWLLFSSAPAIPATLRHLGVPQQDLFGWTMWCWLPPFVVLLWNTPLALTNRCPLCRRSTAGSELVVIATHKCPHCLGVIAEEHAERGASPWMPRADRVSNRRRWAMLQANETEALSHETVHRSHRHQQTSRGSTRLV